ncbi:hypothetical protein I79_001677 [Cricetulus griseus]|uniref:Uncharacterized protein n=1 Tax=Cricetulus griseus TaxID=10029 RepID=G3GVE1_CRIGR|nr:hypothetical protein I79_001677 [Cricetulus griseus]
MLPSGWPLLLTKNFRGPSVLPHNQVVPPDKACSWPHLWDSPARAFHPDHLEDSSRMFPAAAELKPAREKLGAVEKKRRGAARTTQVAFSFF